jgi:hypothetical protein
VYFFKTISDDIRLSQRTFSKHRKTMKLILASSLACVAAILQATGGLFPGIGYLLSPLATAPILLFSMLSLPFGVITYFLTVLLLVIFQPTELMVFPFTTGLLALGIGAAFYFFKKRISIIVAGATLLMLGIMSLLFILRYPILGPAVDDSFSFLTTGIIFLSSFFYSWLWVELGLFIFKRLKMIIS